MTLFGLAEAAARAGALAAAVGLGLRLARVRHPQRLSTAWAAFAAASLAMPILQGLVAVPIPTPIARPSARQKP